MNTDLPQAFIWSRRIFILGDPLIMKQLGIAVGIPFGLVILILFLLSGEEDRIYALYGMGLILLLLLITLLFLLLVYQGCYEADFEVNRYSVSCQTSRRQRRINKIINSVTVFLGMLSGKPSVAGAGMLAQSRQVVILPWKEVRSVRYYKKRRVILFKGGFGKNIAVYCTNENYLSVEAFVKEMKIENKKI